MVTRLDQLRQSIAVLAGGIDDQLSYLEMIGHIDRRSIDDKTSIDELALQFEDADGSTARLAESGLLSSAAKNCIQSLSSELTAYSGHDAQGFWTLGALKNDHRWSMVREKALKCLLSMS